MSEKNQSLTLPLLVTRSMVLFPETQQVADVSRDFSMAAVHAAKSETDSLFFVTCQIDENTEKPKANEIHEIGTLARIISISDRGDRLKIRLEVIEKVKLSHIAEPSDNQYFVAKGEILVTETANEEDGEVYMRSLREALDHAPSTVQSLPRNLANTLSKTNDALLFCYSILNHLKLSADQKQKALEIDNVSALVPFTVAILNGEVQKEQIDRDITNAVRESSEKAQKEYYLREKLKAIKKELGENVNANDDPDAILEKLEKFPYPDHVKAKVKAEIKKFEMMPSGSLEAALIQSYLDVIMNVPWWQKTEDNEDLSNVERILDEDHYGLEDPKKRIVEYLAVKKLTGNLKSPILCFYGPPGTGKTSLGKSIARALGRKFFKASLGGISDEAEIRGHRRTYVGSLPGRIIQGMRKAGVTNPVFLLDEVDKLASSYKGDPASALLEVLDPEQNNAFNDNYMEEPYDLSDVLFICTANYLDQIPGPLRDRLELIQLSSYTEIEKVHIAKEHLVKKQIEINGLKEEQASFTDEAITFIIRKYTREAGVRELERKIASCLRKVAVAIVKDPSIKHIEINEEKVLEYLRTPIFEDNQKEKEPQIGVVTGLAYTEYGGDILPIEVNYFPGKGVLSLTGNLGNERELFHCA